MSNTSEISFDVTFGIGKFYVCEILFRNIHAPGQPTMCIGYLFQKGITVDDYKQSLRFLIDKMPALKNASWIFTDKEAAVVSVLEELLPNVLHLLDWHHWLLNSKTWLANHGMTKRWPAIHEQLLRFRDCETRVAYERVRRTVWRTWPRIYREYYLKFKEPQFLDELLYESRIRLGLVFPDGVTGIPETQRSEGQHPKTRQAMTNGQRAHRVCIDDMFRGAVKLLLAQRAEWEKTLNAESTEFSRKSDAYDPRILNPHGLDLPNLTTLLRQKFNPRIPFTAIQQLTTRGSSSLAEKRVSRSARSATEYYVVSSVNSKWHYHVNIPPEGRFSCDCTVKGPFCAHRWAVGVFTGTLKRGIDALPNLRRQQTHLNPRAPGRSSPRAPGLDEFVSIGTQRRSAKKIGQRSTPVEGCETPPIEEISIASDSAGSDNDNDNDCEIIHSRKSSTLLFLVFFPVISHLCIDLESAAKQNPKKRSQERITAKSSLTTQIQNVVQHAEQNASSSRSKRAKTTVDYRTLNGD